jgi:hypothetical protein
MSQKRCTNCGRFPFCTISMNNTACYEWTPRENKEVKKKEDEE